MYQNSLKKKMNKPPNVLEFMLFLLIILIPYSRTFYGIKKILFN